MLIIGGLRVNEEISVNTMRARGAEQLYLDDDDVKVGNDSTVSGKLVI